MKKWIKIVVIGITAILVVSMFTALVFQGRDNRHLRNRIQEQSEVIVHQAQIIDSLLARRMKVVDCHLSVTDKSRFNIYGRYNKGTINVPSDRTYTLSIDSANISLK